MRSRPKVKLLLDPGLITPGRELLAEAVLTSTSETPVDFVCLRLQGKTRAGVGQGKYRATHESTFYELEWKSGAMKMPPGEHTFPTTFVIPEDAPATYIGDDASITYTITVHVAIPWWPDRKAQFGVPIVLAPMLPPDPSPATFATLQGGPRGKEPFMEIAVDATSIAIGEVLTGSVSLQNLHGKRIRGIDLSFVEMEKITLPSHDVREGRRFRLRVHDGAPVEGQAIPFRVRLPESATITVVPLATKTQHVRTISIHTYAEIRAEVAWGEDITLRVPISVFPKATGPRASKSWVAPIGRERQLLVWQTAATKLGLIDAGPAAPPPEEGEGGGGGREDHYDDELRMTGQRGAVTVEIGAAHRDNDFWLIAKLGWPDLGIDLDVSERKWSDALAINVVKSGDASIDDRLCAHSREHAQAKAIVTPEVLLTVLAFDEVKLDDDGAKLALRGAPHVPEKLEPFIGQVLAAAEVFDRAIRAIPAPALFSANVPAWQAFADRLRGRLELGSMWIHDAQVGTDACEIGSVWSRAGLLLGSMLVVTINPPLESSTATALAVGIEDPSLSINARDAWRALVDRSNGVTVKAHAIMVEIEGKLDDPQVVMPILELAIALRRALGGSIAAGPFR